MTKNKEEAQAKFFGYHVSFNTIKDSNNNLVARIKNHQIISQNPEFEKKILKGVNRHEILDSKIKRGKIAYNIVSCTTNQVIAKVDNYFNVYTLDDKFMGTLYDKSKFEKAFIYIGIMVILTAIIVMIILPKTGETIKPKELIIRQADNEVVEEHWDIFSDAIYPGKNGEYYFTVTNEDSRNKIIYLDFSEENDKNIPIMYRLKKDGEYVCGDEESWLFIDDVYLKNITISGDSTQTYILEWYWYDDGNRDILDTILGMNSENAVYVIYVKLTAELKK